MSEPIHAHFVFNTIFRADKSWRRDELITAIRQQFGRDVLFQTCHSEEPLNPEELVEFLETHEKIVNRGDGFRLNKENICGDHDGGVKMSVAAPVMKEKDESAETYTSEEDDDDYDDEDDEDYDEDLTDYGDDDVTETDDDYDDFDDEDEDEDEFDDRK
jgi:probable metal-binding protein